jgi:rare lipoprotein A
MAHVGLNRLGSLLVVPILSGMVAAPQVYAREAVHRVASKRIARASWYGKSFRGKPTASGGTFNPYRLTAAHRTLNLGSKVKVTELRSGRSVVVEITDRGPFYPGRDIDLSYAAARELGIVQRGVAQVRVEVLGAQHPASPAPIVTAFSWPSTPWLPRAVME